MLKFIKDNFLSVIIVILIGILLVQRCERKVNLDLPIIIRDTVWMHHDSTIYAKPQLVNTIHVPIDNNIIYLPDTNYNKLVKQYQQLLTLYLDKNIHKDTLRIKKFGYIAITDTVSKNLISNRIYDYNVLYPEITNTVIMPLRRNQFYIGGALQGSVASPVNQINAGLLLKNKKDQIFGLYSGINKDGQIIFGLQSYWKISFRKQQ